VDSVKEAETSAGRLLRGKPASLEAKTRTLQSSEVFSSLNPKELGVIATSSRMHAYRADERIFGRGEPGDAVFVVASGTVRMLGDREENPEVIAELVAGDTFGELDLLSSSARSASAVAAGGAVVLRFPGRGIAFERVLSADPAVSARLLFVAMRVVAGRIRRSNALVKENSPWVQEVRRQVYGDKLTGLYNKTYLEETVRQAVAAGGSVALLMFKPDNFKYINDTCGHEAGDAVLRLMAVEVRRHASGSETAARYMGNELAVLLPGADAGAARSRAEALRTSLGELDLTPAVGDRAIKLTVSFGVAVSPDHATSPEGLIAAAHALPLVGRERGGDRILFPGDAA
jgi:diguanylate cyclase (GGDEF)-like protein